MRALIAAAALVVVACSSATGGSAGTHQDGWPAAAAPDAAPDAPGDRANADAGSAPTMVDAAVDAKADADSATMVVIPVGSPSTTDAMVPGSDGAHPVPESVDAGDAAAAPVACIADSDCAPRCCSAHLCSPPIYCHALLQAGCPDLALVDSNGEIPGAASSATCSGVALPASAFDPSSTIPPYLFCAASLTKLTPITRNHAIPGGVDPGELCALLAGLGY